MNYIINEAIAAAPARRYFFATADSLESAMQKLTVLLEKISYESAQQDGLRLFITHPCGYEERVKLEDVCKLTYGRCSDCQAIITFEDNRILNDVYEDFDYDKQDRCAKCIDRFFDE
ncbi:hypothetical protein [Vibrio parahaemolyticus]|uniref:hypothetical protein n=1 Tax=Vibrio parahaemolyticus TaxID=670 RepID=UPI00111F0A00|nr:hypothetical protein [Vibrio parahaemolyticus]TOI26553.1 hypothetical protein CGI64_16880 [Vibrio parahaemolyticus]HCG6559736.1 hypothetical protein [Vibrio parahaemolyticus]HCG6561031.1 hypothetical protein [Vibrio parahaemolyticus]